MGGQEEKETMKEEDKRLKAQREEQKDEEKRRTLPCHCYTSFGNPHLLKLVFNSRHPHPLHMGRSTVSFKPTDDDEERLRIGNTTGSYAVQSQSATHREFLGLFDHARHVLHYL